MTQLFSLHVGVNKVDPAHYGSEAPLLGCENDARDMQALAAALGYRGDILLTKDATSRNFLQRLSDLARALGPGDTLLLTLACHGSQIADPTGEEADRKDETWCLFDRMILDDEAYAAFSRFLPGARIIVISDSCHSGTSTREMLQAKAAFANFSASTKQERSVLANIEKLIPMGDTAMPRCIDPWLDRAVFSRQAPLYEAIKFAIPAVGKTKRELRATGPDVVLISGCQDHQTSADGSRNGYFTENLAAVWNQGGFNGNYQTFRQKISDRMN